MLRPIRRRRLRRNSLPAAATRLGRREFIGGLPTVSVAWIPWGGVLNLRRNTGGWRVFAFGRLTCCPLCFSGARMKWAR